MTDMPVINETVTNVDSFPTGHSNGQGFGCLGIVFGISLILAVLFMAFGYPHYNTPHSWVFWVVGFGTLLIEAFVLYIAVFISRVVNT